MNEGESCETIREELSASLVTPVAERAQARIEGHLSGCAACRKEAAFLARVLRARPEPPEGFVHGTLDRAYSPADVGAGRSASPGVRSWFPGRTVGWAAAAVVAAVAIGVGLLSIGGEDPDPDPAWALALDPVPPTWYGDDWIVAGEPQLELLSDDVLLALLSELEE